MNFLGDTVTRYYHRGNPESYTYIDLGRIDGRSICECSYVYIASEAFKDCPNFIKVTYTIKYKYKYSAAWSSSYFDLYLLEVRGGDIKFSFHKPQDENSIVDEVRVYSFTLHRHRPLVVCFTTRDKVEKYYRYEELVSEGIKLRTFANGSLQENDLTSTLKVRNLKVNKQLTLSDGLQHETNLSKLIGESYYLYYRDTYTPKKNSTPEGCKISTNVLIGENIIKTPLKSVLNKLSGLTFFGVRVYYEKIGSKKNLILLEFINDSFSLYFCAKDKDRTYWEQETSSSEDVILRQRLDTILSDIKDKVTYLIDESTGYNSSIKVSEEHTTCDYFLITQTLNNKSSVSITYILYKDAPIITKLPDELKNKKFTTVKTYAIKKAGKFYPLLICLAYESSLNAYYSLTDRQDKKEWTKEVIHKSESQDVKIEEILFGILDRINYTLNKSLRVVLSCQNVHNPDIIYNGRKANPPNNNKTQLKVSQHPCPSIQGSMFICYKHELTECSNISDVAGLRIAIDQEREIKLYVKGPPRKVNFKMVEGGSEIVREKEDQYYQISHLYYTKCKGNLHVYFYQHKNTTSSGSGSSNTSSINTPDTVPLMFSLNYKYYSPDSIDEYYHTWHEVDGINDCSSSNYKLISTELDKINKLLNAIILSKENSYGIPKLDPRKNMERVKVDCKNDNGLFYKKVTHSTINNGPIGKISHSVKIAFSGVEESHYSSIAPNTVVAFFLRLDSKLTYPLLICLGKNGKYSLSYELQGIGEGNKYKYRKLDSPIEPKATDIEQRLREIIGRLGSETEKKILEIFGDRAKSLAKLAENLDQQSLNLMKTVIPVGGTYLVAGVSIYPASAFLHSFLALI